MVSERFPDVRWNIAFRFRETKDTTNERRRGQNIAVHQVYIYGTPYQTNCNVTIIRAYFYVVFFLSVVVIRRIKFAQNVCPQYVCVNMY